MEWTENQLRIIDSSTLNPERIRNGNLLEKEKSMLEFVNQAEQFLAERYPEEKFIFREQVGNEGFPSDQFAIFRIVEENTGSVFYLRIWKDGEQTCWLESFYALRHSEEMEKEIAQLLESKGCGEYSVWMVIDQGFGSEFSGNPSVGELLEQRIPVRVAGGICLPEYSEVSPEVIRDWLQEKGVSGRIRVVSVLQMPSEGVNPEEWLMRNQAQIVQDHKFVLREGGK